VFGIFSRTKAQTEPFVKNGSVMSTVVYQKVYGINGADAAENVSKELQRIDSLWSPAFPGNIIDKIRISSGTAFLPVDKDTVNICRQAKTFNTTKRFHHILDPQTGYPAETDIASVTVISDSSCLCDALSTAAFVLGIEEGMKLCNQFDNTEALFIEKNGNIKMTDGMAEKFTKGDPND
jgi:thiamine biosynthesis lipoprotein ApbE